MAITKKGTAIASTLREAIPRPATRNRVQPEAVIFTGLQGAGKSTFYRERFFGTHLRLNLDMLRTRRRETLLLNACLAGKTSFVADDTNPTIEERARYIVPARAAGYRVTGYYFDIPIAVCLKRNTARPATERVPPIGLYGTRKRLHAPTLDEGFDTLYRVSLGDDGALIIEEWTPESEAQQTERLNP